MLIPTGNVTTGNTLCAWGILDVSPVGKAIALSPAVLVGKLGYFKKHACL